MNAPVSGSGIGASVRRKEDYRFLVGGGKYTDDVTMARQTFAYFLRSPHSHAKIVKVDKTAALQAPGVVAIFTGEDLAADKIGGLPCGWLIHNIDGCILQLEGKLLHRK